MKKLINLRRVIDWQWARPAMLALAILVLLLSGCAGKYSKQRADEYDQFHRNTIETAERALGGKLTPVELRSHLESINKSREAEEALKGGNTDLEAARAKWQAESDQAVAKLFDGDNGRE